jgi:group II intron reverse transcriptase/maturase
MSQQSLFDQVTSERTLGAAWKRVRRKGSAGGHDGVSVGAFAENAGVELARLREELLAGEYVPEPLREVSIPKGPHTRERRVLRLPSVRDKVVQQAARATLAPVLGKDFLNCSYGYRPGKGPQRAVRRVTHYLRHVKCRWVVAADIDDFFDSLDQERLLNRLQAALGDERVLQLITLFLQMGAVDRHGDWRDMQAGIGQGNAISPLLANFYLHPFDVHLTGQGIGLVRYADDFVAGSTDHFGIERMERSVLFVHHLD